MLLSVIRCVWSYLRRRWAGRWRFASFAVSGMLAISGAPLAQASTVLELKRDCGAVGDGAVDDSAALRACLVRLNEAGRGSTLHVPSGLYDIAGTSEPMPVLTHGGSIKGDGPSASVFSLGQAFSGELFSWSEAWIAGDYKADSADVGHDVSGASVVGLKIVGTRQAVGRQAALTFFDRNDFVLLRDLLIEYVNGPCLQIGRTLRTPQAYMRESRLSGLRCWNSGTATEPAIEIGSTTTADSDATNEINADDVAVFAAKSVGLAIRNPAPFGATRKIRFFGLRVEQSGGDDVQIAPAGDDGQVSEIDFYALSALTAGGAGLRIGAERGKQPYAIGVHGGVFGPGNKIGVAIDNGRLIDIDLSALDAPVVLGPGAGSDISIRGNGFEHDWRFAGTRRPGEEAVPLNLRSPYALYGLPNAGGRIGAAALKGEGAGDQPIRLTMDGKPPDAYNCFNPGYEQAFSLDIQLMAIDRAAPDRFYAWHLPLAVLTAWSGASAARLSVGDPSARGVAGASVEAGPDTRDGCLALAFRPPKGDRDLWAVTAAIHFARAP